MAAATTTTALLYFLYRKQENLSNLVTLLPYFEFHYYKHRVSDGYWLASLHGRNSPLFFLIDLISYSTLLYYVVVNDVDDSPVKIVSTSCAR